MKMLEYKPKVFKDIFNDETESGLIGKEIWKFLNTEEIWLRMELTTQLEHPAVEGIGDKLLENFSAVLMGDNIKRDRYKQMIGHMVKVIMNEHGYVIWQKGVKCRKKRELFIVATKYCKKEDYSALTAE